MIFGAICDINLTGQKLKTVIKRFQMQFNTQYAIN